MKFYLVDKKCACAQNSPKAIRRVRISALMGKSLSDFIPYYVYNAFLQETT